MTPELPNNNVEGGLRDPKHILVELKGQELKKSFSCKKENYEVVIYETEENKYCASAVETDDNGNIRKMSLFTDTAELVPVFNKLINKEEDLIPKEGVFTGVVQDQASFSIPSTQSHILIEEDGTVDRS
jgi:hypothetical protein